MASTNYSIQLVSVRPSLLSGETEGLAMFLQANPHSVTGALANSYAAVLGRHPRPDVSD